MISTNQLKNGNHIEVDGTVFKVLEFQHVKPGKGGAFVRTKLRRASDGNVIDKTFRAGEKFRSVRTEARKMTFLYTDGTDAHFMDAESYEQMAVPEPTVAEALRWTKPNESVDVLFIDGQPSDLQLPASVVLEVSQTDPGLRGDTASGGGTKPATLETGATIHVPLFVDVGDSVKVGHALGRVHVARLSRTCNRRVASPGRPCVISRLHVIQPTTEAPVTSEQIERETVIAAPVERVWALLDRGGAPGPLVRRRRRRDRPAPRWRAEPELGAVRHRPRPRGRRRGPRASAIAGPSCATVRQRAGRGQLDARRVHARSRRRGHAPARGRERLRQALDDPAEKRNERIEDNRKGWGERARQSCATTPSASPSEHP